MQIDAAFRNKIIEEIYKWEEDIICIFVPDTMTSKMYTGAIKNLVDHYHCDYNTTRADPRTQTKWFTTGRTDEPAQMNGKCQRAYTHLPAAIILLGLYPGDAPFLTAEGNVDKDYLKFLLNTYKRIIITCRAGQTATADKFFED